MPISERTGRAASMPGNTDLKMRGGLFGSGLDSGTPARFCADYEPRLNGGDAQYAPRMGNIYLRCPWPHLRIPIMP